MFMEHDVKNTNPIECLGIHAWSILESWVVQTIDADLVLAPTLIVVEIRLLLLKGARGTKMYKP